MPLPPPRAKNLGRNLVPLLFLDQVDALMTLDIHSQLLMLVVILTWSLYQMDMYHTLS
jgi:hypothetical protein